MPLILADTTTSELWLPTSSLPATNPYGLASSPDGTILYVTCANGGAGGAVVAIDIATKTVSTIDSGLEYVKHGIDTDPAGNVYYTFGPNDLGALKAIRKWDGTSVNALGWQDYSMFGLCTVGAAEVVYERRPSSTTTLIRAALVDGVVTTTASPGDTHGQFRGIDTTTSRILACNVENGVVYLHDLTDGTALGQVGMVDGTIGVHAWKDDEAYTIASSGRVHRFNPSTGAGVTTITTGLPLDGASVSGPQGAYGDIHITSTRRCFVTRGGWSASSSHNNPYDGAYGTDIGIYELAAAPIGGPTVGFIGFGTR